MPHPKSPGTKVGPWLPNSSRFAAREETMMKPKHEYNFHEVTGPAFLPVCLGCKQRLNTAQEKVYADSNGPAFEAYYCQACKDLRS